MEKILRCKMVDAPGQESNSKIILDFINGRKNFKKLLIN